ncbi:hypothetical protein COY52_03660 [Candidatus Desantisbacteria bacterium CG_4_10_14_0_8_um_filter_48_22]|uniref:Uncharacterized protein n=1 Tax=Candidatus Desantisbacteria bacterium CG_4_10_14_0_8_um_filter_48_22 TaxID=1974543 RepID=A0A2M7SDR5_9BACT|nr:MAG: hypothetical protein AUJ67_06000 [Candidatus Desantisbacteria bacterium CG1_02_49_89]PIV56098.1 MAG: hypothetical protein COS16_05050 [Candidatus Desantisbacteria bacterium CG02_land_8_20_14_3_00_49_13]PIZ17629.1 MAG: hypothetical protein COY52_03660 [Candidatus Desantisbacteria bacterium CG_4_10_14_0_8_um_filter_48_22]
MDFKTVLKILLKNFRKENIRYALIGGFALGALDTPRSTVDIDFLVHLDDMPKVDEIMKGSGYECRFKSGNVSQYVSPLEMFGEVDFLHAFRKTAVAMLERAVEKDIFKKLKIRVLQPEDIIGLKIQAAANDENRVEREYSDIGTLMKNYGKKLNWDLLEEYFSIFKEKKRFSDLKKRYHNAER